ncbi:MAG: hypothetical protein JSU94_11810 [Phycisphaerales bacterium]|nr:MAG: hypothetical protein JSU94_11810 [Phycisphaerales bacterium]
MNREHSLSRRVTQKSSICGLLVLLTVATGPAAQAAAALDVGGRRQVFIDGRFIERSSGVDIVVHRPRKTGDIVLKCEHPWEQRFGQYHSVLYDSGVYHLWYTVYGRAEGEKPPVRSIAYAKSKDGIHWEKPWLGLVEIYGTRENNIVLGHGFGGVKGATHGCMVFLDPKAPPDRRFRLVSNPAEFGKYLHIFSSPDGIHWKLTHRDIMKFRSERHHLDSQNVIFLDERIGRYVAYVRRNMRPPGSQGRSVARAESDDLSHFPDVEDCPVVIGFDEKDPTSDISGRGGIQVVDFYTNGTVKYPWAEDAYYMFPSEYFHYGTFLSDFRKGQPVNAGSLDARFAAGRDGVRWERYDRRAFVDLGMSGDWDSRSIYMAYGLAPGGSENEMFMYYCGSNMAHGWDRDDQHRERNKRLLRRAGGAPEIERDGIGRLVIRRDGFLSVRAGYTGGEFTTPLLTFAGDELAVNVDTSAAGQLQVEILDGDNKPLDGYTLADCDQIYTANEIARTVTWNGESGLGPLAGKPIRLRFVMRDTDLYAFEFRTSAKNR